MSGPLDSPRAKVAKAKVDLKTVKRRARRFAESEPYRLVMKDWVEAGLPETAENNFLWFIESVEPVPDAIGVIVGDILHKLRSALDHIAWQCVLRNGVQAPDENTNFPIHKAPRLGKGGQPAPIDLPKGASNAAFALIDAAQPYQRGNDYASHPLYILHRLNIIEKHQTPVLTLTAYDAVNWSSGFMPEMEAPFALVPDAPVGSMWTSLGREHAMEMQIKLSTLVTLDVSQPGGGEPITDVIERLTKATSGVIETFARLPEFA